MLAEKKLNFESPSCPFCFGTGMEIVPGKGARRCKCRASSKSVDLVTAARIPKRYDDCTFDSYFPLNPSQEAALMFGRKVAEEYPNLEIGLLFMGTCGVGKTHLAISLAIAAAQSGRRVYYGTLADLITSLEEAQAAASHR